MNDRLTQIMNELLGGLGKTVVHARMPGGGDLLSEILERQRAKFEAGNEFALLEGLYWCTWFEGAILPEWIATGLRLRIEKIRTFQATSWDDAFGKPYPKGLHVSDAWRRHRFRWKIYGRVKDMNRQGAAIDRGLFEEVAKDFNMGKTLCEELYVEANKIARKTAAKKRKLAGYRAK